VKGTVTRIEHAHQRGEIRGENGKLLLFVRESLVLGRQFDDLQPGTPVTIDVEGSRAINVRQAK